MNLTSIYEGVGSIPGLAQWVEGSCVAVSCGVGRRRGSHLALLWLWHRPVAIALIQALTWEPPYAVGAALKIQKKERKKEKKKERKEKMQAAGIEKMQVRNKPSAICKGTKQQNTLAHWSMKNIKLSLL